MIRLDNQNKRPIRSDARDAVYDIIDGERDYQDETWSDDERKLTPGEFLILFEEYVAKARSRWVKNSGDVPLMNDFRKLVGIGVRAMETHGAIPRELHVPASAGITGVMVVRDRADTAAPTPQDNF
jgi:hypothetical protein